MTLRTYRAPKFEAETKRQVELNYNAPVAAGAWLTLLSGFVMYPFRILQAKMIFTREAGNLVEHRWYISGNNSAPTTSFPSDVNIFGQENPYAGFIGNGIIKRVNCNVEVPGGKQYVKLGTFNGNAIVYNINCSIIIRAM